MGVVFLPGELPNASEATASETQIVFMPQKSTIQHALPLHLGASESQVKGERPRKKGLSDASQALPDAMVLRTFGL